MIKIAITGGIGIGKSYISHLLETMDVPVYNADNEAKRLMVSDEEIRRELIALLGKEVYDKEGALNKPLLASYLFSAPEHVRHQCYYSSQGEGGFYPLDWRTERV